MLPGNGEVACVTGKQGRVRHLRAGRAQLDWNGEEVGRGVSMTPVCLLGVGMERLAGAGACLLDAEESSHTKALAMGPVCYTSSLDHFPVSRQTWHRVSRGW